MSRWPFVIAQIEDQGADMRSRTGTAGGLPRSSSQLYRRLRMPARRALLYLATCACVVGCGASRSSGSHSTNDAKASTTSASAPRLAGPMPPPVGIRGRVLTNNELKAFTGSPTGVDTGVQNYLDDSESGVSSKQMNADSVRLKRLGFIRGVVEDLSMGATDGVSMVEQFHSASAAKTELAAEIAEDKTESPSAGSYAAFAVPGIPGAHGISFLSGRQGGINVAFFKGPYVYLIGQELGPSESVHSGIAKLDAAAQHLYHRASP
jgi:hypothetical protein